MGMDWGLLTTWEWNGWDWMPEICFPKERKKDKAYMVASYGLRRAHSVLA